VLRRDRSKIMKLRMLYILHNKKFGVFSSQTNGTLQNIATKDRATPEIEQSLVQASSLGQTQLERFVERRLLSADREE